MNKTAKKYGYSRKLQKFLNGFPFTWNKNYTIEAIHAQMPERAVLVHAFNTLSREPDPRMLAKFPNPDKCEISNERAEEVYKLHCDPDGRFRFENFHESANSVPTENPLFR